MGFNAIQTGVDNESMPVFTVSLWSKLPPTKEEIEQAHGTVCTIDLPRTVASDLTPNKRDISFIPSLDSTHSQVIVDKRKHNARLVDAEWASILYVVRTVIDGERVRIFNIARHRDSGALYVFTYKGMPYKQIKARKHVTPKYVIKALDLTVDVTIDCVQLDAIRNARTESRATNRVSIPNLPYMRTSSIHVIKENDEDRKKREKRERENANNENYERVEYGMDEDIHDSISYIGCADIRHNSRPSHDERIAMLEKRKRNIQARQRAIQARQNRVTPVI